MNRPDLCKPCGRLSEPVNNGHGSVFLAPYGATLPQDAIGCGKMICATRKAVE